MNKYECRDADPASLPVAKDKDSQLFNPDEQIKSGGPRTVYLDPGCESEQSTAGCEFVPFATYNSAGWMERQRGYDRAGEAAAEAEQIAGTRLTARFFEEYLRRLLAEDLTLVHVLASHGNGTPDYIFGYRIQEPQVAP